MWACLGKKKEIKDIQNLKERKKNLQRINIFNNVTGNKIHIQHLKSCICSSTY